MSHRAPRLLRQRLRRGLRRLRRVAPRPGGLSAHGRNPIAPKSPAPRAGLFSFPHRITAKTLWDAKRLGLHRALCGFAADRARRPPFRALAFSKASILSEEIGKPPFPAKTPVRVKPDGLTPVALRARRPLIAPSRPSSSRLGRLERSFWRRKVGRGSAHARAPGVSAPPFL